MRRREFLGVLGGTVAAWPLTTLAQQSAIPVIGFLGGQSPNLWADQVRAFHLGLSETGFVEGRNVAIEYRWAEGQYDRLPELAAELVRLRVAVIAANGPTVPPAKAATMTIPIVFVTGVDPVKFGLLRASTGRAAILRASLHWAWSFRQSGSNWCTKWCQVRLSLRS